MAGAVTSKKQKQLFDTARSVFFQHGIRRVSVEEVCRKAQVSKMTFYRYYKDKMDLAGQIMAAMFDEAYDWFADLLAQDLSVEEVIERIITFKEEIASRIQVEFMVDLYAPDSPLPPLVEKYKEKSLKLFFEFLEERQQKGEIRANIHPKFIMAMVDKMMEMAGDRELLQIYSDQAELARALNEFLFYGIINSPTQRGEKK